ncbi:MAG: hypothetical protein ACM3YO_04765 [Bacteroidota bacterium]
MLSLNAWFSPKPTPPSRSPVSPASPARSSPSPKASSARLAKFHDLLSHAEIDRAKLSADLQSRRKNDPNTPVIEATKAACERISQRIKKEARNEQDLESFNQLLAFFESIPRSLKGLQFGSEGPRREEFCRALAKIAEAPIGDLNQLKIHLNLQRMAYDIPSFPATRKYC